MDIYINIELKIENNTKQEKKEKKLFTKDPKEKFNKKIQKNTIKKCKKAGKVKTEENKINKIEPNKKLIKNSL